MKRLILVLHCFIMLMGISFSASAENVPVITIEQKTAEVGDTVEVGISIENNTGVCAMTIDITYQSDKLQYIDYKKGILSDYSIKAYPEKNKIRFVSAHDGDFTKNGEMLKLVFKVKKAAENGICPINIEYSKGDFCNWEAEILSPKIVSGGIEIKAPEKDENAGSITSSSSAVETSSQSGSSSVITDSSEQSSSEDEKDTSSNVISEETKPTDSPKPQKNYTLIIVLFVCLVAACAVVIVIKISRS